MRIAVLSDIHSNLVALEAVLAHMRVVDAIWHLGDVVGYGPQPDAVVGRLAQVGALGVRGNHDAAALGGREIDDFNPEAKAAMLWTRDRIGPDTRAWLATLPTRREEGDITLVHGSPRDPTWEYVTSTAIARASFAAMTSMHGLHGHTHVPVAFFEGDRRVEVIDPDDGTTVDFDGRRAFLNPGSVGQPRDGDPRAAYLVIDPEAGTASWHRVPYDHAAVAAEMRAVGLPERLAARLRHGH